ncbi:MAG TPA: HAMP domain-containing sensor histidine kinase, partial [Alphaproteobacteria bacterium]|nr:HAMP domain-containing sensor histidine kinase [Alphaproteobacteria bacterium]
DRAEASNSAKSAFLSAMSHELRTPLNSIIGFAALIEAMGDNRSTEYAALIRESGEHLLGLVNDLLDLSKIEAGQMELHEESVDVQALVASAVRMMQPQAQRSDIALDWTVESGLAPLRGDERRLRQVLLNLIGNAVKYTQSGGRIRVAAGREADGRLALAVADTGIGIDPAEQGRVMEAFVQVDNTVNRGVQGTGLGLPLARRLTELHGGTLTLDSAPGLGTTVTIHLPPSRIAGLS